MSSPGGDVQRAVLIYNAGAGGSAGATPEALQAALREVGYGVEYRPTHHQEEVGAVLGDVTGTVFVAGGDGTVRGVALHLAGRAGAHLAPIPMGTSNNVARTLGMDGPPLEVARRYGRSRLVPFDLGRVTAPWGGDLFLEACGCGLFADVLAAYDPEAPKSPLRAVGALITTLPAFEPLPLAVEAGGVPLPVQALALLEVMNIQATGNGMRLAPSADPGDGRLDLVRVDGEHRDSLLAYLSALARGDFGALPSVQTDGMQVARIAYLGQAFHVDGEVRAARPGETGEVHIEVWPGAVCLRLPDTP